MLNEEEEEDDDDDDDNNNDNNNNNNNNNGLFTAFLPISYTSGNTCKSINDEL